MKSLFKNMIRRGAAAISRQIMRQQAWTDLLLLQGAQASLALRGIERLYTLGDAEFKVFSQWGEDGIIEWLVSRLPGIPQSFIEFGVEDYTEANTRFLLNHRNWRGLIIDGDADNIEKVRSRQDAWRYDLAALDAFITRDNIDSLISGAGFGGEIGLLSVDIDGNDYWVWEKLAAANPWIVIIEYNAVLGDLKPLSIPYAPDFRRTETHSSALYYGASAPAFERLAAQKGYSLAGSNLAGNNLFYLRKDVAGSILPLIGSTRPRPSLYAEARTATGDLSLTYGVGRRDLIDNMPVTDLGSGRTASLREMGDIYSPYWMAIQQGNAPPEAR